jgi:hypothetical protein
VNTQLLNVLMGKNDNSLYPFFLLPEDVSPEVLRLDIQRLAKNKVMGVCIEPVGNKHFAGPKWWDQMDAIMDEARALGMRVWLQDESSFPTGNANYTANEHPELQKICLEEMHIDAFGPQKGASFLIQKCLEDLSKRGPELIGVSACKKVNKDAGIDGGFIPLTHKIKDGVLLWDLPEGHWRIFILYTIKNDIGRPGYLNIFDKRSISWLIEKNYEPHFRRYAKDFGKTFAGFFSDEPEFGNVYSYANDNSIGRKKMPLPWSNELALLWKDKFGELALSKLPALWYPSGEETAALRYAYMDLLTKLYEKNFSIQLGEWCRERGCEYIGHIVEDMGNHAKLGCSVGHFFRAMTGQDYAGIDVVLQQIRPGMDEDDFSWQGGETGGEFFQYGLAKLGSSAAHIDANKKGRSICEIFAAYGYSLGLKSQKWLFDHMLVRGINHYIPLWHVDAAFSDTVSRYEGHPQFRHNHLIANYTNRLCHLFNEGIHIAPVAVLYHGEAEWSGNYMPFEKPVRVLLQNQIDCDILPPDVFAYPDTYGTMVTDKGLKVNQEQYQALIIPYAHYITVAVAEFIVKSIQSNFPVFFIDALPEGISDALSYEQTSRLLFELSSCSIVTLNTLAEVLHKQGCFEIIAEGQPKGLRYYHYKHKDADFFLFTNEEAYNTIQTMIQIPISEPVVCYDAMNNCLEPVEVTLKNGSTHVAVTLQPYQSRVLVFGDHSKVECSPPSFKMKETIKEVEIHTRWELSLSDRKCYPEFEEKGPLESLINITANENYPEFSGTMRYDGFLHLDDVPKKALISLGEVYETAEVWLNGSSLGVCIAPPYIFEVNEVLKIGKNTIRIEVINTLAHEMKDSWSKLGILEPSGLLGPVKFHI